MKYSDPRLLASKPGWLKQVGQDLQRHEGFRKYAYPDPKSKLGLKYRARKWNWGFEPGDLLLARYGEVERDGRPWTVGYGYTRGTTPRSIMEKAFADNKLEDEILHHIVGLDKLAPGWDKLPLFASSVIANMAFNMGLERLSKFKPSLDTILAGRYKEAGARLRKTLWFKQVGSRAEELVQRLEKQAIEPVHLYKP